MITTPGPGKEIKLHLGCGSVNLPGWFHIDAGNYSHVMSHDVTKLPFGYGEVSQIYASHLLSYFDREEGLEVLKEWARVLNGKMWISVPDYEAMAKLYLGGKWPIEDFLGPLYGKLPMGIYHKTAYDERSLSKILHKAGFTTIRKADMELDWPYHLDQSTAFLPDRNPSGTLISLNLIAFK